MSAWLVLIGLVQLAVVARFLGPEDFGIVAFLSIVIAVCDVFVTVGFSDAIIASKNLNTSQLSTLYWINVGSAFLVYAILVLIAPLISLFIDNHQVVDMVRLIGCTLILGCISVQFEALARKELRFRFLTVLGILQSTVACVVAVGCVSRGFGVWSMIYSALAAQTIWSITLVVYAWKSGWLPKFKFEYSKVDDSLKFGVFRIGAALLNNINSRSDQFAILIFLGPIQLGYYSLAYNIAMKPFQRINPILTKISFPIFARVSTDRALMRVGYRKGLRLLMFINAPLLLGYISVAPLLVPMFLGSKWEPVVMISQILAIYALFRSAANINIGLILANGKYRWPFYLNLLLVFLIPTCIFLASSISESVIVVSCVLLAVQLALFVMGYILFARKLLGPFGLEFLSDLQGALIAAFLMSLSIAYLGTIIEMPESYLQLIILVAIGSAIYIAISVVTQRKSLIEVYRIIFFRD